MTETEQETLQQLREYWQWIVPVSGEEFETEWREACEKFTPAEMAQEIIEAWHCGAVTGQSGGYPTGAVGDFLAAVIENVASS